MIELPEAALAAHEIAADVRLPERRHERSDARDARHGPLRPRRGAGARSARAGSHRAHGGGGQGGRDTARDLRRGRLGPADGAAARGPGRRRAERGRGARGSGARLDPALDHAETARAGAAARWRRATRPRSSRLARAARRASAEPCTRPRAGCPASRSGEVTRVSQRVERRLGVLAGAVRRSSVPPFAPSASTESRLFASASRSPAATWMIGRRSPWRRARSRPPAGRAGRRPRGAHGHRRGLPPPAQSLPAPRASSADRATSSSGMFADAVTAAATAPSTIGASTSRTCAVAVCARARGGRSGSRCRDRRAPRRRTPWSAARIAARTRSSSVPRLAVGRPPAGSIRTSGPAICAARAASPSARSELCDTTTIPTTALSSSSVAGLIYTIEVDSTISNRKRTPKRGSIQSVDRAARILKALAAGPRRLGVSELADRLSSRAPPSTACSRRCSRTASSSRTATPTSTSSAPACSSSATRTST